MNAEKETKLKEKLAIWRGFEWWSIHLDEDKVDGIKWKPLGGVEILMNDSKGDMPYLSIMNNNKEVGCPDFPTDLSACFKWLVPKYIAEVCLLPMGLTSIMSIYAFLFAEWLKVMERKVEPTLALCLVIERLIDSDKNG